MAGPLLPAVLRVALACVLLTLLAAPAAACSCAVPPATRQLVPASGALAVQGAVRVFLHGRWPTVDRLRLAEEYRLRGPAGLVPLQARVETGAVVVLEPADPLQAGATYVLEQALAYGDGALLTDRERWVRAGFAVGTRRDLPSVRLERRWTPVARYLAIEGGAEALPVPVLSDASWSQRHGGGDCGPGEGVGATATLPLPAPSGAHLAVEVEGQGILWRGPILSPSPELQAAQPGLTTAERWLGFGDLYCTPEKVHLDLDGDPRLRPWLITADGRGQRGAWVEAQRSEHWSEEVLPHGARSDDQRSRERTAVAAFLQPPVVEVEAAPGPAACPFGLESVSRRALAQGEWAQRTIGPALWLDQGQVQVQDDDRHVLLAPLDGAGELVAMPVERGTDLGLVPSVHGPLLIRRNDGQLWVHGLDPDGRERWRLSLGLGQGDPLAVAGEDGVLVAWSPDEDQPLRWVLLDPATGELLAEAQELGPPGARPGSLGRQGGDFLLAWSWQPWPPEDEPEDTPGSHLSRIDATGGLLATEKLPAPPGGQLALAVDGSARALAWSAHGRAWLAWLDQDADPIDLGPTGGSLQLVLRQGLAFVGHASRHPVVLVADHSGALSPAWTGQQDWHLALAATETGLLALTAEPRGGGRGWNPVVETLACRAHQGLSPPPRLAR